MVSVRSFAAAGGNTASVLQEIGRQVAVSGCEADFLFVFFGCRHEATRIHAFLTELFPHTPFAGGTSHDGLMTDRGLFAADAIGLLAIEDAQGQYGAAIVPFGDDKAADSGAALRAALDCAGCSGELPAQVWVYQAPGGEEIAVEGLRQAVADRCPIAGGSAAGDGKGGKPQQIGPEGVLENGIVVATLFPSGDLGSAFEGGFEPTEYSGVVTRVVGRELFEIDHRPAMTVYREWTGNLSSDHPHHGGNIHYESARHPLGVEIGSIRGVPSYLLVNPKQVTEQGTMTTFAAIPQGTRVYFMRGNILHLAERAGRVSAQAAEQLPGGKATLAGGVMIFCAGCQSIVQDRLGEIARDVGRNFAGQPFLLGFTYGEIGRLAERNVHGNMMISAVAFGR